MDQDVRTLSVLPTSPSVDLFADDAELFDPWAASATTSPATPSPRRWSGRYMALLAGALVATIVALWAGYSLLFANPSSTDVQPFTWNGVTLPVSNTAGPLTISDDGNSATGFAQSPEGAAFAALWLSTHVDPAAGPQVFTTTITTRIAGDTDRVLAAADQQYTTAAAATDIPSGAPIPVTDARSFTGWTAVDSPAGTDVTIIVTVNGDQFTVTVPLVWDDTINDWKIRALTGDQSFAVSADTPETFTPYLPEGNGS